MQCLEKDPENRPRSASELARRLRAAAGEAEPRPASSRARRLPAVLVALVILGVSGWFLRSGRRDPGIAPIRSIAVLPLVNLSADPEQDYFADGLTEALIADLARIEGMRVISRTSSMRFKGTHEGIPEIAKELGVEALVEGSVRCSDEDLEVTIQLIRAASEDHLWAETFRRPRRDNLTLQRELARSVARQIRVTLAPDDEEALARPGLVDPGAYEAYLRGRHLWNKRTGTDFERATEYFREAQRIDPGFAGAWAGLADVYVLQGAFHLESARVVFPLAIEAARKALELDPTSVEALTSLSFAQYLHAWDWEAAESGFRRALDRSPSYVTAHHWLGDLLMARGRFEEALDEILVARELDPLSAIVNRDVAWHYFFARRPEDALEQLRSTLELEPHFSPALSLLGRVLVALGQFDEAIRVLERCEPTPSHQAMIAHAHARAGRRGQASAILAEIGEEGAQAAATEIALVHVALGDAERAFELLESALEERDPTLVYLAVDPRLDPLRADPRYLALLERVGL